MGVRHKIRIELKAILEFDPDPTSNKSIPQQMRDLVEKYTAEPMRLITHHKSIVVFHGDTPIKP